MQVDTALITMVAAGIAAWMKQRGEAKKAAARSAARPTAVDNSSAAAEEEERTRKVQEEVRRKIAERRAGIPSVSPTPVFRERAPAPPVAAPRPVVSPWEERMTEVFGSPRVPALRPEPGKIPPAILPPIEAGLPPPIAAHEAYAPPSAVPAAPVGTWLSMLRDPGSVRRAVVLREVLGAPVALR